MAGGSENMPKDLQVMKTILEQSNITDYEPIVLNQMLEFTYRYVTNVVDDASLYSSYAKKKSVDSEDVKLAISLQQNKNFANVPSREMTAEVARHKNAAPLPNIRSSAGLNLPSDRNSLTACCYTLKQTNEKQKTIYGVPRSNPNGGHSVSQRSIIPERADLSQFSNNMMNI